MRSGIVFSVNGLIILQVLSHWVAVTIPLDTELDGIDLENKTKLHLLIKENVTTVSVLSKFINLMAPKHVLGGRGHLSSSLIVYPMSMGK